MSKLFPSRCFKSVLSQAVSQYRLYVARQYRSVSAKSYTACTEPCSRHQIWNNQFPNNGATNIRGLSSNRKLFSLHSGSKFSGFAERAQLSQLLDTRFAIHKQQSRFYPTSGFQKHIPSLSVKRPARKKTLDGKQGLVSKYALKFVCMFDALFVSILELCLFSEQLNLIINKCVDIL